MSFLPLLLSTALMTPGVPSKAALLTAPDRHVRTLDGPVERLLATGLQRSATFASLMLRLQHSDVIVYVQQVHDLPHTILGRLQLVPLDHQQRYLRIEIGDSGTDRDRIALVG
ncbi:MAG TPA: hypothetical protein VG871_11085, partial [Vicinamibacterales bacterium]|nr:hypothetical protein [Vicinamibacterales bacterium]